MNDTFELVFHTAFHQPVSYATAMRSAQDEEKKLFLAMTLGRLMTLTPPEPPLVEMGLKH